MHNLINLVRERAAQVAKNTVLEKPLRRPSCSLYPLALFFVCGCLGVFSSAALVPVKPRIVELVLDPQPMSSKVIRELLVWTGRVGAVPFSQSEFFFA